MGTSLRIYDGANVALGYLPDFTDLAAEDVLNDVGGGSFAYPRNGENAALLDTEADRTIAVVFDGTERARILLEDDGRDEADPAAPLTISGRSTMALLERALVWPSNGVGSPQSQVRYITLTPGGIIRDIGLAAQMRGAIPTVTFASFTTLTDSAGQPWARTLSITYQAGQTNLLAVVLDLVERGLVDVRMVGTDLRVYNAGTTLAPDLPGVVLRRGRDLASAPRTRTRREVASVVLMGGEDGLTAQATDAAAVATFGRREVYETAAGVTDTATLGVLAGLAIESRKRVKVGYTTALTLDPDGPRPWLDFDLGAWVRQDALDGTVLPVRVRGLGVRLGQDGVRSVELVLNDRFEEAQVALARRVAALTGGADATIGVPNTGAPDRLAPSAPSAVAVVSAVYQAADGQWYAQATADWPDVVTNSDGTVIEDLDGYLVSYLLTDSPGAAWSPESFTSVSVAFLEGLPVGKHVQVRVRARDRTGNLSGSATSANTTLAADTAAPQTPSALVPTATIGGGRLTWDGLGADGQPMPADFVRAVLYVSTVTGFAPSTATARGDFVSAAAVTVGGLPYVVHYAKTVAYDRAGNPSGVSAEVSFTPRKVVGSAGGTTDFAAVSIGDADVGNMSVTRLTAGSLLADVVLGSRIKTADTGARAEMSSVGFRTFDAAGVTTFEALASTGAVTVRGTLVASDYYSRDTHPRIQIGPSSQYGSFDAIEFTRETGTVAASIHRGYNGGGGPGGADDDFLALEIHDAAGNFTSTALAIYRYSGLWVTGPAGLVVAGPLKHQGNFTNLDSNIPRMKTGFNGKVLNYDVATVTTDASGFATITHGLGATPAAALASPRSPNSGTGAFGQAIVDTYGASTFRIRAFAVGGTVLASTTITLGWFAGT